MLYSLATTKEDEITIIVIIVMILNLKLFIYSLHNRLIVTSKNVVGNYKKGIITDYCKQL